MVRILTLTTILAGFAAADNRVFGGLGDRSCQACLAKVEETCRGPIGSKQYNDCFCAVGEDGEAWAKLKGCITDDDGSCADDQYNVWSYWGAHCFAYKDDEEEEVCVDSSQDDDVLMSVADSFCTEFLTPSASASASASASSRSSRSSATASGAQSTETDDAMVTVETETSTPTTTSTTTVAPTPSNTKAIDSPSGGSDDDSNDDDDKSNESNDGDSKDGEDSKNGDQKDDKNKDDDKGEDGGAGMLSPLTVGGASMAAVCVSGVMVLFF